MRLLFATLVAVASAASTTIAQLGTFPPAFDGELWGVRRELTTGTPAGVAYSRGKLFVVDSAARTVRVYDNAGHVVPTANDDWNAANPSSPVPDFAPHQLLATALSVNGADRDAILISDDTSNRVAAFDTSGAYLFTLRLQRPSDARIYSLSIGELALSPGAKFAFVKTANTLTLSGTFVAAWVEQVWTGSVDSGAMVFQGSNAFASSGAEFQATPTTIKRGNEHDPVAPAPRHFFGVEFDTAGNLYALDAFNERLHVYDPSLNHLFTFGTPVADGTSAEFHEPWGLAFWPDATGNGGRLFINDTYKSRIMVYRPVDSDDSGTAIDGLQLETIIKSFVAAKPAISLFAIALDPSTSSIAVTDFADDEGAHPRAVVLQQANLAAFDLQALNSNGVPVQSVCTGADYTVRFSLTVPAGRAIATNISPQLKIDGAPAAATPVPAGPYPSPMTLAAGQVATYSYALHAPATAGHDIAILAGATTASTLDVLQRAEMIALAACEGETDPSTITAAPSTAPQVSGWTPVHEGQEFFITLTAQDDDGIESIEYQLEGANESGSDPMPAQFDGATTRAVVKVPVPDFGRTTLTYRVRDGNAIWSQWQTLNVRTRLVVNRSTNENASAEFRVGDPEGAGFTYSVAGLPAGVTFAAATGQFGGVVSLEANDRYSTNPVVAAGVYNVVVTERSASGASSSVGFTWTINNINREPIINNNQAMASRSIVHGQLFTVQINGFDPDRDPVIFTVSGRGVNTHQDLPQSVTINPLTGLISGVFPPDADAGYQITVGLAECSQRMAQPPCNVDPLPGERLATLFAFNLAVLDHNDPADVVNPGPQANTEGQSPTLAIQASDPDGDALSFDAGGLPPGLTINNATGVISGTLGASAAGTYAVTVKVDDHVNSLPRAVTFSWVIADRNFAPVVTPIGDKASNEGDPIVVPAMTVTDPDGDVAFSFTAANLPPGVSINPLTGAFGGSLSYSVAGVYQVVVTVRDGKGGNTAIAFKWTVRNVNRPPTAVADNASVTQGQSVVVSVRTNDTDVDGDTLTITNVTTPTSGTVVISGGGTTATYTATSTFVGTATFNYTVSDGVATATAKVTVTVVTSNKPPVCSAATGGEIWPPNHKKLYIAAINGVTDPEKNPITIKVTGIWQDEFLDSTGDGNFSPDGGIENGQAWIRAERNGHGNKAAGDGRTYEILFTATDSKGASCNGSVLWTVPHDQGRRSTAIDGGLRYDSTGVIRGARDKRQIHQNGSQQ